MEDLEEAMANAREVTEALLAHEQDIQDARDALPDGNARMHLNNILTVIRASSIILGQPTPTLPPIPLIEE